MSFNIWDDYDERNTDAPPPRWADVKRIPKVCTNCLCDFNPCEHKSNELCDACYDQRKAADDAARRLAGKPSRAEEKALTFGQRYGMSGEKLQQYVASKKR